VGAVKNQQKQSEETKLTLGDVLYADRTISTESEQAWVDLMHSVAARDATALYDLYERTHRLIYTLILRITGSPEAAEELTLAVLYDVWSEPWSHDPAKETVLGWIMNQARSKALDRARAEKRDAARQSLQRVEQDRLVHEALQALTPQEREAIESAYFSESPHPQVAARLRQQSGSFKTWLRSGVMKLRQALVKNP
jgi:RNA polymerase sigma-70 factor (ECF subfamily)